MCKAVYNEFQLIFDSISLKQASSPCIIFRNDEVYSLSVELS